MKSNSSFREWLVAIAVLSGGILYAVVAAGLVQFVFVAALVLMLISMACFMVWWLVKELVGPILERRRK